MFLPLPPIGDAKLVALGCGRTQSMATLPARMVPSMVLCFVFFLRTFHMAVIVYVKGRCTQQHAAGMSVGF